MLYNVDDDVKHQQLICFWTCFLSYQVNITSSDFQVSIFYVSTISLPDRYFFYIFLFFFVEMVDVNYAKTSLSAKNIFIFKWYRLDFAFNYLICMTFLNFVTIFCIILFQIFSIYIYVCKKCFYCYYIHALLLFLSISKTWIFWLDGGLAPGVCLIVVDKTTIACRIGNCIVVDYV